MKKIIFLILTGMLSSTASAAGIVSNIDYTKVIGSSSVSGYTTLDDAILQLQENADKMGGSKIYITGAGGKNKISATGIIMK